jgi:hypothetical protein
MIVDRLALVNAKLKVPPGFGRYTTRPFPFGGGAVRARFFESTAAASPACRGELGGSAGAAAAVAAIAAQPQRCRECAAEENGNGD